MDTSRLGRGEMIAGVSGLALLIVMFIFDWFSVNGDLGQFAQAVGVDTGVNAWQAFGFIDIVLFITVVVAVGLAAATGMSANVGLPVAGSALTAGLGIISVILIAYRIIDPPGGGGVGRDIGVWLGLITAAGVAYGGWTGMQEEGTSFSEQADRLQSRGGPPTGGPPAGGAEG